MNYLNLVIILLNYVFLAIIKGVDKALYLMLKNVLHCNYLVI